MVRRSQQTAWRTIADETVLLDLEKKQMYGLNRTAAFVWQHLEAVGDLEEMLQALKADGQPGLRAALEAFLAELIELGLALEDSIESKDRADAATFEPPESLEPPAILWKEEVEQIAGTCAFLPAQNPLCTQAPFS